MLERSVRFFTIISVDFHVNTRCSALYRLRTLRFLGRNLERASTFIKSKNKKFFIKSRKSWRDAC